MEPESISEPLLPVAGRVSNRSAPEFTDCGRERRETNRWARPAYDLEMKCRSRAGRSGLRLSGERRATSNPVSLLKHPDQQFR